MTGHALGGLWVLISQIFQVKKAVPMLIVSGTRHLATARCHAAHVQLFHREQLFLLARILWTSAFFKFCSFQAAAPWIISSGWFLSGFLGWGGCVVTMSPFALLVKHRLPNPQLTSALQGTWKPQKGGRNWKYGRTRMQRDSGLIPRDTGGTLGCASHWGWDVMKHQLPWTSCGLFSHPAAPCRRWAQLHWAKASAWDITELHKEEMFTGVRNIIVAALYVSEEQTEKKKPKQEYTKKQMCIKEFRQHLMLLTQLKTGSWTKKGSCNQKRAITIRSVPQHRGSSTQHPRSWTRVGCHSWGVVSKMLQWEGRGCWYLWVHSKGLETVREQ